MDGGGHSHGHSEHAVQHSGSAMAFRHSPILLLLTDGLTALLMYNPRPILKTLQATSCTRVECCSYLDTFLRVLGGSISEVNETALSLNCPFPAALILIGPHLGLRCSSTFCRASAERRTSERGRSVLADAMLERAEVQHQVDEIDVTDHKSLLVACQIKVMSHSVCILRASNAPDLCNLFVLFVVSSFILALEPFLR